MEVSINYEFLWVDVVKYWYIYVVIRVVFRLQSSNCWNNWDANFQFQLCYSLGFTSEAWSSRFIWLYNFGLFYYAYMWTYTEQ